MEVFGVNEVGRKRVCVVGAGAAGLAAIRHIAASETLEGTVFESAGDIGGIWRDDGLTPLYKGLKTNLPKQIMGFLDFSFDTDNSEKNSFLMHYEVLNFLTAFTDKFSLKDYIHFNTKVLHIRPVKKVDAKCTANKELLWEVTYERSSKKNIEYFDAVAICNGHFNTSLIPGPKQLYEFKGKLMYSREYRIPEPFTGKNVLVYGCGPSGIDIMLEIVNLVSQITFSFRRPPYTGNLPDKISQKPPIKDVHGYSVTFQDGTISDFDVILICTGYEYDLPFLTPEESCLRIENGKFISPLYRHMINISYPTMALIGLPFRNCPFMLFDCQMRYFVKLLEGKASLPTEAVMLAELEAEKKYRIDKQIGFSKSHQLEELQWPYMRSLAKDGNFSHLLADLQVKRKIYEKVAQRRHAFPALYKNDEIVVLDNESYSFLEAV
ncbi:flavin-containing monooxygenase FMO GS-OX-like 6 [Folsomia candida]|uniref:flavin-containing monooxygenase FMO GS-OX-like 6 n=1 Tax=Folsomia candida TaxID=158441 RepID=UPI000B901D11|nr:flavin-containing monooxygenase FMO GS-OX-like 6 [Folsomia candida]